MFLADLFGTIISLALFGVFSAGVLWYTHEKNLGYWLNNFGELSRAKVIDKQVGTSSRGFQWAYIHYRFTTTGNPVAFYREQQVSHQRFSQSAIGDTVTIRYYPANPEISRLDDEFADRSAYQSARFIGCFCMILGFFFVYPALLLGERLYHELRVRYLLNKFGRMTQGNIVGHERLGSGIHCLKYQYNVKSNAIRVSQQISHGRYLRLNDRDSISVCYLTTNPTTARLVAAEKVDFVFARLVISTLFSIAFPILCALLYGLLLAQ
jgi:hypothetical protein